MGKRLDIRLPDEYHEILEQYCKRSGATKTGAIKMLILVLKDEQLLAILRKLITVD
ncbi:CopG family transcriptional regulator [Tolypothrix sp. VBCCA 56010]|uniref:CopG family transcriptional regulator n=1 Tax=Tolypothrix sp. VBCCA 56010 TaxID=3137731 RepID=UPI003D7E3DC3